MELLTLNLTQNDVTEDGITIKKTATMLGNKKINTTLLCFTLNSNAESVSSFYYKDELYMIHKQDENYIEAICIEVKRRQ